jgi:outer membrane protein assembly factor BamB
MAYCAWTGWKFLRRGIFAYFLSLLCSVPAAAQSHEWPPPQAASSAERLLMEQVQDLQRSGQAREALTNLQKLFDQSGESLIEAGGFRQVGTLKTQRYIPLREWCIAQMGSLLAAFPDEQTWYRAQVDGAAEMTFRGLQQSKEATAAKRAALRYRLSSHGERIALFLTDLYLERGWPLRALKACEQLAASELRYRLPEGEWSGTSSAGVATLPWWYMWSATAQDSAARARLLEQWGSGRVLGIDKEAPISFADVAARVLLATAFDASVMPGSMESWLREVATQLKDDERGELSTAMKVAGEFQSQSTQAWPTFAGAGPRVRESEGSFDLSAWPEWQHQLERYSAASDRTTASQPRVGERERGTLPYHPVVVDGRVYINEMNRIRAYDLKTGKSWPQGSPVMTLFDSHMAAATYVPLGYPLVGTPRGTLTLDNRCLYARMGSPVTGWANREMAEDGGSLSYLIGLDLGKQGSLLRGFPLRLVPPDFSGAEFEGCPLVWGDLLLVSIVERDNVGIRRSVAAFDRWSGDLRWRSPVLAAGSVEGSDSANLITHQLLTMAGGSLYYNTNLGSIVCLDPLTGQIEWLQRYQRNIELKQGYPRPDRFKYRDLTPCMVAGGLVYCLPRDCAELFALDATTGELVWATDDVSVADAIHLLGVCGNSLIVSGDRLIWLDRWTGRQLLAYPGSTTPGAINALPSPRGLGRGVISNSEVYWPVAGEVFVFAGDMSAHKGSEPVSIRHRYRVTSGGREGGNLTVADGYLIYSSPSRILAFAAH